MVVDHREAPAVAALTVNAPAGVPSIDFARPVSFTDNALDLKARQTPLAQPRFRVLGPSEALDAHGGTLWEADSFFGGTNGEQLKELLAS